MTIQSISRGAAPAVVSLDDYRRRRSPAMGPRRISAAATDANLDDTLTRCEELASSLLTDLRTLLQRKNAEPGDGWPQGIWHLLTDESLRPGDGWDDLEQCDELSRRVRARLILNSNQNPCNA